MFVLKKNTLGGLNKMNSEQYEQWKLDAFKCLLCKYTEAEANKILQFFDNIHGRDERELIGDARVDAMSIFVVNTPFSLYDSFMARLWVYAPEILKQNGDADFDINRTKEEKAKQHKDDFALANEAQMSDDPFVRKVGSRLECLTVQLNRQQ